jgi:hypothetical protein
VRTTAGVAMHAAAADPYSGDTTSRVHVGSACWWASESLLLLLLYCRRCGVPCNQQQDMGVANSGKRYRSVDRLSNLEGMGEGLDSPELRGVGGCGSPKNLLFTPQYS